MIYINGRFLTQPITGVGRFALEICRSLQNQGVKFTVLVPAKYKEVLDHSYGLDIKFVGRGDSHIWEQIFLWLFLLKHSGSLLISFSGLGPVFYKNKILTIHDLSFFHEPKWFSKAYYIFYAYFTPIAAHKCKHILTVSEFSKAEIIKYLNVKPNQITVVYNGNSFTEGEQSTSSRERRYILGVSSLDPRKNHAVLLQAFELISEKVDMDLILVGKAEQHFNFNLDINKRDNSRVHFTGYISDEKLKDLYKNASLFVYPSLYEGFGIPPLEAIFYRCPVLISDIPVFNEIFQQSATYFNPNSVADLENKLLYCLDNRESIALSEVFRADILEKYSWDKSALIIIKLLASENITND